MNNLIKSINIYLAVYGLTLDCDPKETRDFTILNIVDKDGKVAGSVNLISLNKYKINISLEKYRSIECNMTIEPKRDDKCRKSYKFSYDIRGTSSSDYDHIQGRVWINESHIEKTDGFDVVGHMSFLKAGKKVAFFTTNGLKRSYEISIGDKKLSFGKPEFDTYDFVLENPKVNYVHIVGKINKSNLSNYTEYYNRKSNPAIVEKGGKPIFNFKATAPIPLPEGHRIVSRIFEHVRDMKYTPSVEDTINKMRLLTANGTSNFFDNLIALSFNDFTLSTVLYPLDFVDLEAMFGGNPKTKLGVPNIDSDGVVSFNTTQKIMSRA